MDIVKVNLSLIDASSNSARFYSDMEPEINLITPAIFQAYTNKHINTNTIDTMHRISVSIVRAIYHQTRYRKNINHNTTEEIV